MILFEGYETTEYDAFVTIFINSRQMTNITNCVHNKVSDVDDYNFACGSVRV
jgi:hypothetical protein